LRHSYCWGNLLGRKMCGKWANLNEEPQVGGSGLEPGRAGFLSQFLQLKDLAERGFELRVRFLTVRRFSKLFGPALGTSDSVISGTQTLGPGNREWELEIFLCSNRVDGAHCQHPIEQVV
jgi:hypothetical protein